MHSPLPPTSTIFSGACLYIRAQMGGPLRQATALEPTVTALGCTKATGTAAMDGGMATWNPMLVKPTSALRTRQL